jgi:chemosensory pili system protein ChpA (sensor histidine kinase/response regulator)
MTLAVVKAVLVRTHGQTFAVPLAAVSRISRPGGPEDEPSDDPELVRVGDGEYRRVVLGDSLRLQRSAGDEAPLRPPVLVVNTGGAEVALVVDQLLGAREVVVKNLGNHLRQVHGVAGATLLGDGTVVLIVNPADLVRQPVRRPMVRVEQKAPPAESRPLTVMVVDDSPSVRRVLSNLLRATGWTPLPARDGLEALEILEKLPTPPDLMLVDVEMPRMDGYELLATVKSDEGYPEVPVVMVTSRAGAKHRGKASELGADGFLVKPYQDQQLLATIRRLADATRA